MNGVLNVLKPPGMTSHDVVAILRRITGIKKIGHTGTLDPNAAGVLPICIGRATKLADYLADMGKAYTCEMTLGATTDTQDVWGEVTASYEGPLPSPEAVLKVAGSFVGPIDQIPPMYSAIKVGGQKLYDLARAGKTIAVKSRPITIHSLRVLGTGSGESALESHLSEISAEQPPRSYVMDIQCSKGTYVRTICHDIGEKLGCHGHMSFLVRTRSGVFTLEESLTMEMLSEMGREGIRSILIPMDVALGYEALRLDGDASAKVLNGVKMDLSPWLGQEVNSRAKYYNVYDDQGQYLGIGVRDPEHQNRIKMERLLNIAE